jgi:hypothetical protein
MIGNARGNACQMNGHLAVPVVIKSDDVGIRSLTVDQTQPVEIDCLD